MSLLSGRHRTCTKLPKVRFVRCLRRRYQLFPVNPFFSTSLSSLRPPISVGPRIACLQAKRCVYLWYAHYPCSIFQYFYSRLFNVSSHHSKNLTLPLPLVQDFRRILFPVGSRRFPSSSAPAFHLHVHSRGCLTRSELALQLHNFCSFSVECLLNSPRLASSGHWVVLV